MSIEYFREESKKIENDRVHKDIKDYKFESFLYKYQIEVNNRKKTIK